MIIVNATLDGESTYEITIGKDAIYQASAFTLEDALDRVADYLEAHNETNTYIDEYEITMIAECSKYQTIEAFAQAMGFTRCGTNGIYLEITNVKGCPNG